MGLFKAKKSAFGGASQQTDCGGWPPVCRVHRQSHAHVARGFHVQRQKRICLAGIGHGRAELTHRCAVSNTGSRHSMHVFTFYSAMHRMFFSWNQCRCADPPSAHPHIGMHRGRCADQELSRQHAGADDFPISRARSARRSSPNHAARGRRHAFRPCLRPSAAVRRWSPASR